jgi:hypothetical protein
VIDAGEPAILVGTPTLLTHQENWMTSQLNYLVVKQSRAELASRAEQARLASEARLPRSASESRWDPPQAGDRSRSLGPATLHECT